MIITVRNGGTQGDILKSLSYFLFLPRQKCFFSPISDGPLAG